MNRSEKAWKEINKSWSTFSQVAPESESFGRLRDTLKDLQQIRLPITAIDLIGHAINQAYKAALEESFCPECGIRGDETVICSQCGKRVDVCTVDGPNGICEDCADVQSEEDEE